MLYRFGVQDKNEVWAGGEDLNQVELDGNWSKKSPGTYKMWKKNEQME